MAATGELQGKVAIVTGGSRGIGRAMSLAFAAAGAQVIVAARTENEVPTDSPPFFFDLRNDLGAFSFIVAKCRAEQGCAGQRLNAICK